MTPIDWSRPIETVDGKPCRVVCTDYKAKNPVIVLATHAPNFRGDTESAYDVTEDGFKSNGQPFVRNVPEKFERTVWVNVHRDSAYGYPSRISADGSGTSLGRIACIKTTITGHVGQFDE